MVIHNIIQKIPIKISFLYAPSLIQTSHHTLTKSLELQISTQQNIKNHFPKTIKDSFNTYLLSLYQIKP